MQPLSILLGLIVIEWTRCFHTHFTLIHRHAKSVLSSLGGDVTHLPSHCRQLEWISELDLLNNTPLVCYRRYLLYHCIDSLITFFLYRVRNFPVVPKVWSSADQCFSSAKTCTMQRDNIWLNNNYYGTLSMHIIIWKKSFCNPTVSQSLSIILLIVLPLLRTQKLCLLHDTLHSQTPPLGVVWITC